MKLIPNESIMRTEASIYSLNHKEADKPKIINNMESSAALLIEDPMQSLKSLIDVQ